MGVSLNYGLRLSYRTQEPAAVFERSRSSGASMWAEASMSWNPQVVLQQLIAGFSTPIPDSQTLLSMEIFCSSSLEASDRAAFLTTVSALEPLAETHALGQSVDAFVDSCLSSLKAASSIDQQHRSSLEGRLNQLRIESIRQALRRFIKASLPDHPDAPDLPHAAYGLRSDLIHIGRFPDYYADLPPNTRKITHLRRLLYSPNLL